MSFAAPDGMPLIAIGGTLTSQLATGPGPTVSTIVLDAANEAAHFIGRVFTEDGGSHTLDTSGSSSIGWKTGAVTFAQAGTTVKVGLAAVDLANGPAARAVNVADVVTFDVSKSMTGGGGGITANAWQTHVPDTGTKTVANGDLIAMVVQATARQSADTVAVQVAGNGGAGWNEPNVTSFTGGAYAAQALAINCVITFSDGTLGFFFGSYVASTISTTIAWNSGSAQVEHGNYFQAPWPMKVYGIHSHMIVSADTDLVLYSDPLGTPFAEKTLTVDTNTGISAASSRNGFYLFPSPFTVAANQPIAAIMKPGGSNITASYKTFASASHQKSEPFGLNGYAVSRASGAFAAMSSGTLRFLTGLLVMAIGSGARNEPINARDLVR